MERLIGGSIWPPWRREAIMKCWNAQEYDSQKMLGCSFSIWPRGLGHPGYRSPSQDVNQSPHGSWWTLMKIPFRSNCQSPSWTFLIQIWAVRWKNTASCRFQPHQACSSAISAMESLSSYETLVVLPKGSEVDDETASRIAHLSAESLSDHGTWFDMCL